MEHTGLVRQRFGILALQAAFGTRFTSLAHVDELGFSGVHLQAVAVLTDIVDMLTSSARARVMHGVDRRRTLAEQVPNK